MDNEIIKFIETANKLKDVKRAGWVERGVKDPESVADHNYLAALLCVVIPAKGVDKARAVKMALIHDLAESVIGDIITTDKWKAGGKMSRGPTSQPKSMSMLISFRPSAISRIKGSPFAVSHAALTSSIRISSAFAPNSAIMA